MKQTNILVIAAAVAALGLSACDRNDQVGRMNDKNRSATTTPVPSQPSPNPQVGSSGSTSGSASGSASGTTSADNPSVGSAGSSPSSPSSDGKS